MFIYSRGGHCLAYPLARDPTFRRISLTHRRDFRSGRSQVVRRLWSFCDESLGGKWSHGSTVTQHLLARQMPPVLYSPHMGCARLATEKPTAALDLSPPCAARQGKGAKEPSTTRHTLAWLAAGRTPFTLSEMMRSTQGFQTGQCCTSYGAQVSLPLFAHAGPLRLFDI